MADPDQWIFYTQLQEYGKGSQGLSLSWGIDPSPADKVTVFLPFTLPLSTRCHVGWNFIQDKSILACWQWSIINQRQRHGYHQHLFIAAMNVLNWSNSRGLFSIKMPSNQYNDWNSYCVEMKDLWAISSAAETQTWKWEFIHTRYFKHGDQKNCKQSYECLVYMSGKTIFQQSPLLHKYNSKSYRCFQCGGKKTNCGWCYECHSKKETPYLSIMTILSSHWKFLNW